MATDESHDTESVPELLTNCRLSDLYNLPGESVAMNSEISSAMRAGNKELLEKMKSYETPMACFKNDNGDTILHVAAFFGHLELVKSIVSESPCLLLEPNWKGRIPLHAAARSGRLAVVEVLAASMSCFSTKMSEEDRERLNPYVFKDMNGDTPLHLAMKDLQEKREGLMNGRMRKGRPLFRISRYFTCTFLMDQLREMMKTAMFLVSANPSISFLANKDEISPLYLAVRANHLTLVNTMLSRSINTVQRKSSNLASQLEGRKSLVHAALEAYSTDVLDVILNVDPSLVDEKDEKGQTCISVGASIGFYEGTCKVLDISTSGVFEYNKDGSFPIHKTVERSRLNVVIELLKRCPDSIEQLNIHGQNVLHIAAKNGKCAYFLMRYIKRLGTKNHLMEGQDKDGNTPLHLATIKWRSRTVNSLTSFDSKKTRILDIRNKEGWRPLDIAQNELQSDYIFKERMTLMVLLCVCKPFGVSWITTNGMTLRSRLDEPVGGEKFKDRVNILLLMAGLVATITFAAGFTMPGGFNSSAPFMGKAILMDNLTLSAFLVCDTLAMQFSLIAIIVLVWAQLGDRELAQSSSFGITINLLCFMLHVFGIHFWRTSYNKGKKRAFKPDNHYICGID